MVGIASFVRGVLWFEGIAFVIAGIYLMTSPAWIRAGGLDPAQIRYFASIGVSSFCFGSATILAAWAWGKAKRWCRPLVILTSILRLPLFPIGTLAGVLGLYLMTGTRWRQLSRQTYPAHVPQPGDGTSRYTQVVMPILGIAWVVGGNYLLGQWAWKKGLPRAEGVLWFVYFELALMTCIALHEGGHWLAGWTWHMRPLLLKIGPLSFEYREGKWRFRFVPSGLIGGGAIVMVPSRLDGNLRRAKIWEVAGGPLASLFAAGAGTAILLAVSGSSLEPYWRFFGMIALIASADFLLNLTPLGVEAGYTDGAVLYQLIRGGPLADHRLMLAIAGHSSVARAKPDAWDRDLLERVAESVVRQNDKLWIHLLATSHYASAGEAVEVRRHLEIVRPIIEQNALPIPADARVDIAFRYAYYCGDRAFSEKLLDQARAEERQYGVSLDHSIDYWKALAVVSAAQGCYQEAQRAWQAGYALLEQLPKVGIYETDRQDYDNLLPMLQPVQVEPVTEDSAA